MTDSNPINNEDDTGFERKRPRRSSEMRLLVGTLFSGENEFEQCCQSIKDQLYGNFEHLIVEGKGKAEAHDYLYSTFMKRRSEFGFMVKIDADMILQDNRFFGDIVEEFMSNPDLDWLTIPCYDFLVGRNLGGVNVYRNVVEWGRNKDNLFTDRTQVDQTIRKRKNWVVPESNPRILHCPNPSPYQAFHFGFHRTAKALGGGALRNPYRPRNWAAIREVRDRFSKLGDRRFLYVIAGAESALSCMDGNTSLADKMGGIREAFERYDAILQCEDFGMDDFKRMNRLTTLPFPWDYRAVFLYFRVHALVCRMFSRGPRSVCRLG